MAAAAKGTTWAERRARCLQLAVAAHLDHTAREVDLPGRDGVEHFITPSADRRRQHHVSHRLGTDIWACDCRAAEFGRPCSHIGACLGLHEQRERVLRDIEMTFEQWVEGQRATRAFLAAWGS